MASDGLDELGLGPNEQRYLRFLARHKVEPVRLYSLQDSLGIPSDSIRQVPGLGDLPILGALFRSGQYQRNETELVIIVTPRLVQPVKAGTLAMPTDHFVPPSDSDLFFMGKIEAKESGTPSQRQRSSAGHKLGAQSAGGVDGPYGHIIK